MSLTPSLLRRPACLLAVAALSVLAAVQPALAAPTPDTARAASGYLRIVVKLDGRRSAAALRRARRGLGVRQGRALSRLRLHVLEVRRQDAATFVRRLVRSGGVAYERDHVLRVVGTTAVQRTPRDPLWPQQWGPALVETPTAWAVTRGSPDVVVAVLDTGVDGSQPDLQGAVAAGHDFVNDDADASDDQGHGTAVAGVIAARADNGSGGSGMCPSCTVMPVKVAAADGTASEANVASGVIWAADHGARVINLSLGGSYGGTLAAAVDYANSRGVLVVAAAGNNGTSGAFYPAALPGVLSVGATQPDDRLYSWSNYGDWVAVAAPGCDLATFRGAAYGDFCGTSASTPVVAGLAGLAASFAPGVSAERIRQAIEATAHATSGTRFGRVDVAATLAALGATYESAPAAAPPSSAPAAPKSQPAPAATAPAAAADAAVDVAARQARAHTSRPTARRRVVPRAIAVQRRWMLRSLRLERVRRPR